MSTTLAGLHSIRVDKQLVVTQEVRHIVWTFFPIRLGLPDLCLPYWPEYQSAKRPSILDYVISAGPLEFIFKWCAIGYGNV